MTKTQVTTLAACADCLDWLLGAGEMNGCSIERAHEVADAGERVISDFGRPAAAHDEYFSRAACEVCQSPLGGTRVTVSFID